MNRRLLLLSGLAILAVVCNHAAGWGFTAMFWWTHRYRPVAVPNFDQLGTLPYYVLLAVQQLAVFAVPGFLFISGFFLAYAARGRSSAPGWRTVLTRIRNLLIPYVIWSVVIFAGDALQGVIFTPLEYLQRLLTGTVVTGYFYVPVLCQFYLLSPLVVPFARTNAKLVLLIAASLQAATLALLYVAAYSPESMILEPLHRITAAWLFPGWAFFFAFGIVSGFHLTRLKQLLSQYRWGLLIATIGLGMAAILEPQAPLHTTGVDWGRNLDSLSSQLYAVAIVLCILAFGKAKVLGSGAWHQLGKNSYGIYLLNASILEFVARFTRQFAPWILGFPIMFQPLLVVLGVGVPYLFMLAVSRSPARRYYRYLFG